MEGRDRINLKTILSLLVTLLIALFAVLNSNQVTVNFGFASVEISQAIVILVSVTLGALLMYVIGVWYDFKGRKKARQSNAEAANAQQNIPVEEANGNPDVSAQSVGAEKLNPDFIGEKKDIL